MLVITNAMNNTHMVSEKLSTKDDSYQFCNRRTWTMWPTSWYKNKTAISNVIQTTKLIIHMLKIDDDNNKRQLNTQPA